MSDKQATLRLGTRGSALALWQAEHVTSAIRRQSGAPKVEVVRIETSGDRIQDVALSQVPGQSFFTKEIELALLEHRVDLAVHSLKDLATVLPDGLTLAAILKREDPRDVLISNAGVGLRELPTGARVGTSSLRRRALVGRQRPDVRLLELRGNVPTRIAKLEAGDYDAIILAAAGVRRLGLEGKISALLPPEEILPAPAQGAVAVQIREDDAATLAWTQPLDDASARAETTAERVLLRTVEGGCQAPVGALARTDGDRLSLQAIVASLDGQRAVEEFEIGFKNDPRALGSVVAQRLLERGGREILYELQKQAEGDPG